MTVTQAEIAKLAGVSRATIDRVLNGRGHVRPEVEEKIRAIIRETGYRPNPAGSQLVRTKRPLRIAVIVHSDHTPFIQNLIQEVEHQRDRMDDLGVQFDIFSEHRISVDNQLSFLNNALKDNYDGVALMPIENDEILSAIDRLWENRIPVVTFNTDMPVSRRLCYVGQDNYLSGTAAASLLSMVMGAPGTVLVVAGTLANRSCQVRIDGFLHEMRVSFPKMKILPVEKCDEDDELAWEIVRNSLIEHPEITGLYLSSSGYDGACRAIREAGKQGKVHFVCHDLVDTNIMHIREGIIDFVLDQNSQAQAVRPLEILRDYLLTGALPEQPFMYTSIDYRNRYNI